MSCLTSTSATVSWEVEGVESRGNKLLPGWISVYCCGGARLSALSLSGHLVPLFPRARWGAQASGRGGGGGREAGKGLLRLPSAPHPPLSGEGAGRRRAAGHRCVLSAVCADGVQRGEARVRPGHRGAAWLRYGSAHGSRSGGGMSISIINHRAFSQWSLTAHRNCCLPQRKETRIGIPAELQNSERKSLFFY